jgi:hypothetical protein
VEKITNFNLYVGTQNRVVQRLGEWTVGLFEDGPLVELRASTELDPTIRVEGEKRLMATTLAIHMDQQAAIELSERIRELARTMGWPLRT